MMFEDRDQWPEGRGQKTEIGEQNRPSSALCPLASVFRSPRAHPRSGQAAIEFTIVIFFLLLPIFLGLYHVNLMARVSFFLLSSLRGSAGVTAMQEGATSSAPPYISTWDEGADGLRHTDDDQPVGGAMLPAILADLTAHSVKKPSDWNLNFINASQLPVSMIQLNTSPLMTATLGFVHEEQNSEDVFGGKIVINDFLLEWFPSRKSTVVLKEDVWMPLMGGLY